MRRQVAFFQEEVGQRLARAEKNRALLEALLDVSAPRESRAYAAGKGGRMVALAEPSVDEQYAAAFQRWGLDVERRPEAEVVERLRQEPAVVVQEVLAGLDAWMLHSRKQKRPEKERQRLRRLADALDDREMSRQLRALLCGEGGPDARGVAALAGALAGPAGPWTTLSERGREQRWRLTELRAQAQRGRGPVLTVVLLAQASQEAGDVTGAEQVLRQALAGRPNQVVMLDALARLLEGQGRHRLGEALECYQAARAVRPNLGVALARALRAAGRAAQGEAVLRDLVGQQPDHPELYFSLALTLDEQKQLKEAVKAYRKAIQLRPDYAYAYHNLGNVLRDLNQLDESVKAYRRALAFHPDDPDTYNNLGIALHDLNQRDEAVKAYRRAIQLKPDLAVAHYNLGLALRDLKQPEEAVKAYRKAIEFRPDYASAYHNLGNALRDLNQLGEAVKAYRRALAFQPDDPDTHNNLGIALHDLNQLEEAVKAYRRATQLQPDYAQAHHNLGLALYDLNQFQEAVKASRRAIQLKPDYAHAYNNLGNALSDLNQPDEAVKAYRKAIQLEPDFAYAHHNLGLALRDSKQLGEAVEAFRKANQLSPEDPLYRTNLRRTEQWLRFEPKFAAYRAGTERPANPQEAAELGYFSARYKKHYRAAAHFFAAAFEADPRLAHNMQNARHRYSAACYAALAAAGKGQDGARLPEVDRAGLRQKALTWLEADLKAYGSLLAGKKDQGPLVQRRLGLWLTDADLAGVREPTALAALPEAERAAWRQLWADVAALCQRAQAGR